MNRWRTRGQRPVKGLRRAVTALPSHCRTLASSPRRARPDELAGRQRARAWISPNAATRNARALGRCAGARLRATSGVRSGRSALGLLRREGGASVTVGPWPDTRSSNLPLSLTSFVGRERELDEIAALVREHRLVTITGAGGVGKTQTALRVATALSDAAEYRLLRRALSDQRCLVRFDSDRQRARRPRGSESFAARNAACISEEPDGCCWFSTTASTSLLRLRPLPISVARLPESANPCDEPRTAPGLGRTYLPSAVASRERGGRALCRSR